MKKSFAAVILFIFFLHACNRKNEKATQHKITSIKYIYLERKPLPYPTEIRYLKLPPIDMLMNERDSLQLAITETFLKSITLVNKKAILFDLERRLALNTDKVIKLQSESLCGPKDDSQPVELYDGTLGISKLFVETMAKPVGQLQWKYDFGNIFQDSNDEEGNVKGIRWGTGALIDKNIFITAGHCFDTDADGWKLPSKNGQIITSKEMALLMKVNFNYQIDKNTLKVRSDTIDYPVEDLLEYRNGKLDYAIILLGKDNEGKYPGERFGFIKISKIKPSKNAVIAIIQHPQGEPKKIEAGRIFSIDSSSINYDDIDTQSGSSGSAVITSSDNKIIGIHILGGCDNKQDGSNHATPMFLIRQVSPIIKKLENKF
jgi:V8-like Glu-specific endopeptidase